MVGKQVTIESGMVVIRSGDVVEQKISTEGNMKIRKAGKPVERIVLENLTDEDALELNVDQTNDFKDHIIGARRSGHPKRKNNTRLTIGS